MGKVERGVRVRVAVRQHLRIENKVCLTLALIPAFSPEEKENRLPSHRKTCDWIDWTVIE